MRTILLTVLLVLWMFWGWQQGKELDTRAHRIAQLEVALAQAHAEADTLEAVIDSLEHDNWEADKPDSNAGPIVSQPCAPLAMLREGD